MTRNQSGGKRDDALPCARRLLLLVVCIRLVICTDIAISAVDDSLLTVVALSGQSFTDQTSELPNPNTFADAKINNSGNVLFKTRIGESSDHTIVTGFPGQLRIVAREGELIDGSGKDIYSAFEAQTALGGSGVVAFQARLFDTLDRTGTEGIFIETAPGQVDLAAQTLDQAPGLSSGTVFSDFSDARFSLSQNDEMLMFVDTGQLNSAGDGAQTSSDGYWTRTAEGALEFLAARGATVPNTGAATFDLVDATMAANGEVIVVGSTAAGDGIWRGFDYESLSLDISAASLNLGIEGSILLFDSLFPQSVPALSLDGTIALRASVRVSTESSVKRMEGLWKISPENELFPISIENEQPVDLPDGSFYTEPYADHSINGGGLVSFRNEVGVPGEPFQQVGLWTEGLDGDPKLLIFDGMQVPGEPDGVEFGGELLPCCFGLAFSVPVINQRGQTAFLAGLKGDRVNDDNDRAIVAVDSTGNLRVVAREGRSLEVAPGDVRRIKSLAFPGAGTFDFKEAPVQTLNSGFNDLGELIFIANFVDGTSGVFISRIASLPEPSGLVLVLTSLALVFNCRHRCRERGRRQDQHVAFTPPSYSMDRVHTNSWSARKHGGLGYHGEQPGQLLVRV